MKKNEDSNSLTNLEKEIELLKLENENLKLKLENGEKGYEAKEDPKNVKNIKKIFKLLVLIAFYILSFVFIILYYVCNSYLSLVFILISMIIVTPKIIEFLSKEFKKEINYGLMIFIAVILWFLSIVNFNTVGAQEFIDKTNQLYDTYTQVESEVETYEK